VSDAESSVDRINEFDGYEMGSFGSSLNE